MSMSFAAMAQFSVNAEVTRDLGEFAEGVGVGVSAQYLYPISERLGVGANTGFIYGLGIEDVTLFTIPFTGVVRYYVTGNSTDGGFYPQAEIGMHYARVSTSAFGSTVSASNTSGVLNLGAGYKLENNLDFGLRFGVLFKKGSNNFLGLRVGYTF